MKHPASTLASTLIVLALTSLESLAQSTYEPYTFTTLAGIPGPGSTDGTGGDARFGSSARGTGPGVLRRRTGNPLVTIDALYVLREAGR